MRRCADNLTRGIMSFDCRGVAAGQMERSTDRLSEEYVLYKKMRSALLDERNIESPRAIQNPCSGGTIDILRNGGEISFHQ